MSVSPSFPSPLPSSPSNSPDPASAAPVPTSCDAFALSELIKLRDVYTSSKREFDAIRSLLEASQRCSALVKFSSAEQQESINQLQTLLLKLGEEKERLRRLAEYQTQEQENEIKAKEQRKDKQREIETRMTRGRAAMQNCRPASESELRAIEAAVMGMETANTKINKLRQSKTKQTRRTEQNRTRLNK